MIVCEEALIDGIPEQLRDWDKINVYLEDAAKLATNGLPINEEVYMTDKEFTWMGEPFAVLLDEVHSHYYVNYDREIFYLMKAFN